MSVKDKPKKLVSLASEYLMQTYGWYEDVIFERGMGCWLMDANGKKYLDFLGNYSAAVFGYSDSEMEFAIGEYYRQNRLSIAPGFLLTEDKILLAKELSDFCGMNPAKVVFKNSGAEAVETAMKIARKWAYTQKSVPKNSAEIIFCENNFHGRTLGVISASTNAQYKELFGPPLPLVKTIPFGDTGALVRAYNYNVAAFLLEPIQGEGGINIPPDGYLKRVRKICSDNNMLLILDEVQTGFGRTGTTFACDREGIKPDILILGKALGGGEEPISAVVCGPRAMDIFEPGDDGSTFGGRPRACLVARKTLRMFKEKKLSEKSEELGGYFLSKLADLQKKYPEVIKEVRGRGLFIGIELQNNAPSPHCFCEELLKEGVVVKDARGNVIRFSPPLVITQQEIDYGFKKVEKVVRKCGELVRKYGGCP